VTLLILSALLWAYVITRAVGLPGTVADVLIAPVVLVTLALAIRDVVANPRLEAEETMLWVTLTVFLTPLAVPAYIRLHGLPWRRMM
jgi:hypothetical protein